MSKINIILAASLLASVGLTETRADTDSWVTHPGFDHLAPARSEQRVIVGDLRAGLAAISAKDFNTAMGIRLNLPAGSVERKVLVWAIAVTPGTEVAPADIRQIARNLSDWPGQSAMLHNFEHAFLRGQPDHAQVVRILGGRLPATDEGKTALAQAYLADGQPDRAARIIRPWWVSVDLTDAQQSLYATRFSSILGQPDHKRRMDRLLYDNQAEAAILLAPLANAESLAVGRAAVILGAANAGDMLDVVHASWKDDPGYLFSRIQHLRRSGYSSAAASLLLSTSRDAEILVNPDLWWNERRIISRDLLEAGDYVTAYKIVAAHNAQSSAAQADAEFHAGWYALRFLDDPTRARTHFANCLAISTLPISLSRANYWLGRAVEATGQSGDATTYYEAAAANAGTFYGQLAHLKLGRTRLKIGRANSTAEDRSDFADLELVQAIQMLEDADYGWRAAALYNFLSRTLATPGQLGLLALRQETQGNFNHALRIGKTAYNRGFSVEQLAFPLGAISGLEHSDLPIAYALARQESGFQTDAISSAGARGLLQLMPDTAAEVASRHGLSYSSDALIDDPDLNATIGALYFEEQRQHWGGSYILTLVAYNAGPRRADEWIERFGDPRGLSLEETIDWIERIPYPETRNYVMRTIENYQIYKARLSDVPISIADDLVSGG